jgi:hypothetical protein
MATRRLFLIAACAAALPLTTATSQAQATAPRVLPTAALVDQFGSRIDWSTFAGRSAVLLCVDRQGLEFVPEWTTRLRAEVGATATVVVLADVRGVPRLVRGVVRGAMPKDTALRVFLDWDGSVARLIRGERAPLAVAVYDAQGQLRLSTPLSASAPQSDVLRSIRRAAEGQP